MRKVTICLLIICVVFAILSFTYQQKQSKQWEVPAEYESMKNPVKKTEKVIELGKSTFKINCTGCHGISGKGDGEKVKNLVNITPSNLTLSSVAKESDGNHFYKIKFGRDNLHSFRGKLNDETIWSVVHYVRTLSVK